MEPSNFYSIVKEQYPFNLLTKDELTNIVKDAAYVEFSKNEYIFHENDDDMELFFLLSGHAKNILHRTNGRQFSVRFYYPGELVGLMIMLTSGEMTFSVQALDNCRAIRFNKVAFLEVMSANSEFSKVVLEGIGSRMKSLYDEIKNKTSSDEDENIDLFRTRTAALMDAPIFIRSEATVLEAVAKMKETGSNGLIVSNDERKLLGIFSTTEAMSYLLGNSEKSGALVKDWMNPSPFSVCEDSFVYEALSFFKFYHVESVPVTRQSMPVGLLTAESFLSIQDSEYLNLTYRLTKTTSIAGLASLSPTKSVQLQQFIEALLNSNTPSYEVCELISNYNDKLHRQAVNIAEQEMKQEGYGHPPVPYCFIVMGSEGRKEQAFSTDQDNGIIISDFEHMENAAHITKYFEVLSEKVNTILTECGYPRCTGGIMATNKKWRRTLTEWKAAVHDWIANVDAEEIRDFTIFLDFRPIYGDFTLAEELRSLLTDKVEHSKTLQQLLMKDTIRFRVPLSPLGRVHSQSKEKMINLKKAAIMQIINAVRIYAIKNGIDEVNTLARLRKLVTMETFHPRDAENVTTALHILLGFRLRTNLAQLKENKPLSNEISLNELTKEDRKKLRNALQIAKRMQQVTELSFNRNRVV